MKSKEKAFFFEKWLKAQDCLFWGVGSFWSFGCQYPRRATSHKEQYVFMLFGDWGTIFCFRDPHLSNPYAFGTNSVLFERASARYFVTFKRARKTPSASPNPGPKSLRCGCRVFFFFFRRADRRGTLRAQ